MAGDTKYYIYANGAPDQKTGPGTKELPKDTSASNFIKSLPKEVIVLTSDGSDATKWDFDETDGWKQWMTKVDSEVAMSLAVNDDKNMDIQYFDVELKSKFKIYFSSHSECLRLSFGADSDGKPRIPLPGVFDDGEPLYLGINPKKSEKQIQTKIADLFEFAGLKDRIKSLPPGVSVLGVTLKPGDSSLKTPSRNALWFTPSDDNRTDLRLQFDIDIFTPLQDEMKKHLPGLELSAARVICKKMYQSDTNEEGSTVAERGQIIFAFECTATPKKGNKVKLSASFEVTETGYSISLIPENGETLPGIVQWLGDVTNINFDIVEKVLKGDNLFKIFLQRINILIDDSETEEEENPTFKLSKFNLEIEISSKLGGNDPVAFLVTYLWKKEDDKASNSIRGELWTSYNLDKEIDLASVWEFWTDIKPFTADVKKSLDLTKIIPGTTIENVPDGIPKDLTRAYIFLDDKSFGLGATVEAKIPPAGDFPQVSLDSIGLDASYAWGKSSEFKFGFKVAAEVVPPKGSKHPESANLNGELAYNSKEKSWKLKASLEGLYASTLADFFDKDSGEHMGPLADSIKIANMGLEYNYTSGKGSDFNFDGKLLIAALELDLKFKFVKGEPWNFHAELKPQDKKATMGEVVSSFLGHDADLPDFLKDEPFSGESDTLTLDFVKAAKGGKSYQLLVEISLLNRFGLTFAQYHDADWKSDHPPKRLIKVALTSLPKVVVPLVGDLTQPFDEMYFMWVQDPTENAQTPGITRKESEELDKTLKDKLIGKDKFKTKTPEDVLFSAGAHFAIIMKDSKGTRTCLLDYDFKKQKQTPKKSAGRITEPSSTGDSSAVAAPAEEEKTDSDGTDAKAPLQKKSGPISLQNITLKYAKKRLTIQFDATFEIGPMAFELIGFALGIKLESLNISKLVQDLDINVAIEGLSVVFEKKPLTIGGIIKHGVTGDMDYYAGGLIIGFTPYQLEAAGFYGDVKQKDTKYKSIFVFARLDGPFVELEFAEISGVTGGVGYNSEVKLPAADEITNFPFIDQKALEDSADSVLKTLQKLIDPSSGGWFSPHNNSFWAAAGMKIDCFQMIALDAVLVAQFGESVKLGILAVALVDIPNKASKVKFAHVELGISVVADLSYGTLKAEAQLSPNSYVLAPDCHLTGGFALYYWFDAPHADKSKNGEFVFTIGGYHQAFQVPAGYPNPPRLGISWSLGGGLNITGQAYFAITPKACMGGGRLHAAYSLGPISAWFDVFADFLINYSPFHFNADMGICVGAALNVNILFIHVHISVEISADLTLWGPPLGGKVYLDFKVVSVTIHIGQSEDGGKGVNLADFYQLVLQDSSRDASKALPSSSGAGFTATQPPKNEGHLFLAESGLMNDNESPQRDKNQEWVVRGGTFVFVVSCKLAIKTAEQVDDDGKVLGKAITSATDVYARPMKVADKLDSSMTVNIRQDDGGDEEVAWSMEEFNKSVPKGLWAQYDSSTDPSGRKNHIDQLLNSKDSGVSCLMGARLYAPPPVLAKDKLPKFKIEKAGIENHDAINFLPPAPERSDWKPDAQEEKARWDSVPKTWQAPSWGTGDEGQAGFLEGWKKAFGWDKPLSASAPKNLMKRFSNIYMAAPLMTA